MRILVTGISGFLGWNIVREASHQRDLEIIGACGMHEPPHGISSRPVNLEDPCSIREIIAWSRPDAILHAAAMSSPADCERAPERSRQVNELAVRIILDYVDPYRTSFVLCSTDLVFDGLDAPYAEDSIPSPRSVYGTTKQKAERSVLGFPGVGTVARLSLLYGRGPAHSPSFLGWLKEGLRSGRRLDMFVDEIRTPLWGEDAARALLNLASKRATGIFHLGGPRRISRYDFARVFAENFDLDPGPIRRASQSDAPSTVYRPPDVSLLCERARREISFSPLPPEEALQRLRDGP